MNTTNTEKTLQRGRCVCCGRAGELVALAEGFTGLGWCERCDRENQQGTLELAEVRHD